MQRTLNLRKVLILLPRPPETPQEKRFCYNYGESWSHDPKKGCPARNRKSGVCHKYDHYAKCCRTKSSGQSRLKKGKNSRDRRKSKPKLPKYVNQVDIGFVPRETPSSSDDEYIRSG